VPPDKGPSQDRPLSIASTARRRLARPLAGAGGRAAPVGYRRLHILLRAEGHVLNRKKTQRLYREEGLTVRKRKGRKRATGMGPPILVESKPNARWSVEFVHDQLSNGRRFRIIRRRHQGMPGGDRRHLNLRQEVARKLDTAIARRGNSSIQRVRQKLARYP